MKYQLRNTMLDILIRIEKDHGFSNLLLNHELKQRQFNEKDERLLTGVVYGSLQHQMTLDYYLSKFVKSKKKLDVWVQPLLRMSFYQMIYLEKVPDHAVIHESVEIAKQRGHQGIASFVNGVLRSLQRQGVPSLTDIKDPIERIAIETSHPEWLVKRWAEMYGMETTAKMCRNNLEHHPLSIRIQPLRTCREEVMQELKESGIESRPSIFSNQGIIIEKGNIFRTNLLKEGKITIQDQSSMLVGEMLAVESGMHVLDSCSAPGGKVTHVAEKMQDQGIIHAFDLHAKKIKLIDEKASTLHLTSIHAQKGDARKLASKYEKESFDRIVVDAPCSGLGVINGKPEIKYEKSKEDIQRLAKIQQDILNEVIPLLKENGLLIYSTCTVDKEENNQVVRQVIENHQDIYIDFSFRDELPKELQDAPGWSGEGLQLFPQDFHTDGFFLTRLKKIR
ncbi:MULTISPECIES: 16S rRNA (cytosine(967)-C(5))-methyltransferase RsmB [unclassified Oceanobacillus]|uniref:16S rRNA (cytosine(967)-C(5))-methyltransferase RsmB n=1 Tax=unclassified Oceanobacillus TaxID=2630292 RepID=UPI001BEA1A5B|nr:MULTISPECIES: 16S rRNA (cytosine(967)-C(5))-methyltransferase RsmB [unclassified Oceanobacillus]MBT2598760.1 16S rRNA (cytosine(967)-C(5))-methyltransferase RsmB [Oceanobacillus sp. ISL-74]MBT2651679.1 16S rRNA (cytosine(967)-C(5))-methyltransferase RsmB [Oceanobacillus sp. ISL-73]